MGLFTKAVSAVATSMGLTDPRLMSWATGGETYSGETVTVEKALQLDAVFACARIVARTIATLPVVVYERGEGRGQSRVATDHSLYRVLHDRPNPDMTAVDFWTAGVACMLLWGNAYAVINRRFDGSVVSLEPMLTSKVSVDLQRDGTRTYTYTDQNETTVYREEDVLHLKGFSIDGKNGLSAIGFGRQSLGMALSAERTAGSIFKNGLRPSGYFKLPAFMSKEQRIQTREYVQSFSGAANTGKVPFLEGGWEFSAMSIPPNDAQFLETRAFNVETICRWFGVPPSLIGHTEKTTTWGTGLESINLFFLTYTLRPHLKEIEQAIGQKCFNARDSDRFYAEFNVEGLLRTDSKGRAEYYRTMGQSGFMTPNEIRALENLPPLPGGDHLMVQGAMMPLDVLVETARQTAAKMAISNGNTADPAALPAPGRMLQIEDQTTNRAPDAIEAEA